MVLKARLLFIGALFVGGVGITHVAQYFFMRKNNLEGLGIVLQSSYGIITFLREYLRIDTSNPDNYCPALDLIEKYAQRDGFLCTRVVLSSGYPALVLTLEGTNPELSALALNHHLDVVPADRKLWKHDPFGGEIYNNFIIGRGAQDMKGVGIVQYGALVDLKKRFGRPRRTIHCLVVPDEERGGFKGAGCFINHELFKKLNIKFLLDEGIPSGDENLLLIKIAERTPVQIVLTSTSHEGHSSRIRAPNAIHGLLRVLNNFIILHEREQNSDGQEDGLRSSYHITSLSAGDTRIYNCIPAHAQAIIDIRVSPERSLDDFIKNIADLCDQYTDQYTTITYKVLALGTPRMPLMSQDTLFYKTLARSISDLGLTAKPLYFEATTDSRFYAHEGIEVLGITPFTCLPNLHGINESVPIADIELGIQVLSSFIYRFCYEKYVS